MWETASDWLDQNAELIAQISRDIWNRPEASGEEFFASETLRDLLRENGFAVKEPPLAGLETAFEASFGNGRPYIGFLAEYDALPGLSQQPVAEPLPIPGQALGHGCGHNLLGTAATAAAIALKTAMEQEGLPGTVFLYGCPSEEVMLGKIVMTKCHVFDALDVAISWHPGDRNRASEESYQAMLSMEYHFSGKASHAAMAPQEGLSALDAVELMDVGVNYLREHVPQGGQIHYVILEGGEKPNIVPEKAAVWQFVRANSTADLRLIEKRVDEVAAGAALMTGTTVTKKVLTGCNETRIVPELVHEINDVMQNQVAAPTWTAEEEAFSQLLLSSLGQTSETMRAVYGSDSWDHPLHRGVANPTGRTINILGSSDLSDVSYVVPTCMLFSACYPMGTPNHTWAVTACAGQSIGVKGMLYAAKVMAAVGYRLITSKEKLRRVKESFREVLQGAFYQPVDQ